jgi:anti-anti-sigma regulatory factor
MIPPEVHTTPEPPPRNVPTALQQWRETALQVILLVALGVSLIAIPPSMWSVLTLGQVGLALFYAALLGILAAAALLRTLWFQVRASVLLAIPFLAGVVELYQFGMTRDGSLLLFTSIILSTLLMGAYWGIGFLGAGLLVLGWIAWRSMHDPTVFVRDPRVSFIEPLPLVSSWMIFLLLGIIIVVMLVSLVQRLNRSLATAEQSAAAAHRAGQDSERAAHEALQARAEAEQQSALLQQQTGRLQRTEQHLRDLVATLETPTILLTNDILLAPIIGTLDNWRAQALMERLLTDVQQQQTETVVLDIAGVSTVDSQVAEALIRTTRALQLLGCSVILTGISPSVAITLTHLGIDLATLQIARSPREVLVRHDPKKASTNWQSWMALTKR